MKVRVENLHFSYGDFSLRVAGQTFAEARVTSIVGPNGAGKSTFLKCLAGVLPVSRDSVLVDGKDLAGLSGKSRARLVGYVPQEPAFTFNYSVLDFVLTGRAAFIPVFSSPSHHDITAAEAALGYVGLADFPARPFFELSSGERRLVLIARTLAQEPDILLLDEPTTFLDPRHEIEILDLIRRLAGEMGKTVIVTLHALDMAVKYSDDMVFMKGGRVVAAGRPVDILSEALLKAVYDIEMSIMTVDGRRLIIR
ncbi:MAG: ABC transporter ATP-binding protein [Candidatus Aminicenantes bacterium]|nr:ABC transporter ATP-binding protein [Candidatus Aminicenantes bacterium]